MDCHVSKGYYFDIPKTEEARTQGDSNREIDNATLTIV